MHFLMWLDFSTLLLNKCLVFYCYRFGAKMHNWKWRLTKNVEWYWLTHIWFLQNGLIDFSADKVSKLRKHLCSLTFVIQSVWACSNIGATNFERKLLCNTVAKLEYICAAWSIFSCCATMLPGLAKPSHLVTHALNLTKCKFDYYQQISWSLIFVLSRDLLEVQVVLQGRL